MEFSINENEQITLDGKVLKQREVLQQLYKMANANQQMADQLNKLKSRSLHSIADGFKIENGKIVFFMSQNPDQLYEFDNLESIVEELNEMANDNHDLIQQNTHMKANLQKVIDELLLLLEDFEAFKLKYFE